MSLFTKGLTVRLLSPYLGLPAGSRGVIVGHFPQAAKPFDVEFNDSAVVRCLREDQMEPDVTPSCDAGFEPDLGIALNFPAIGINSEDNSVGQRDGIAYTHSQESLRLQSFPEWNHTGIADKALAGHTIRAAATRYKINLGSYSAFQ